MLLLLGAALATASSFDDDDGVSLDARDLPTVSYTRAPSRVWIGATPPTFSKPWTDNFEGVALGIEANAHLVTPVAWLRSEVRVSYDQAFVLWNRLPFGPDSQAILTVGPRFGLDHGLYGGVGGGLLWLQDAHIDGASAGFFGAVTVYGGYLFRAGDHMRSGPELTLGTRNTLAWRMEWGV